MSNEHEANESDNLMDEPIMPIEHLLPPFRRGSDSPLAQHFAKLDAEAETDTSGSPEAGPPSVEE